MLVELIDVEVADFKHARHQHASRKTSGSIHMLPAGEGLESGWRSWRAGREAGEKLESRERGWRDSHYHMRAPILARCFCVTLVLINRVALEDESATHLALGRGVPQAATNIKKSGSSKSSCSACTILHVCAITQVCLTICLILSLS